MSVEWTIEQWVEHGREWLAAGWVWAPGQVGLTPWQLDDGSFEYEQFLVDWQLHKLPESVPDLRDPGTRGHALKQVREAFNCSHAYVEPVGRGKWWAVMVDDCDVIDDIDDITSEHEALLAARRAAP